MPEQLEIERISWFINQLWRFYVETIQFKFIKIIISEGKTEEQFPTIIFRPKENMPMFTNVGGVNINIYEVFSNDKNIGEIRLTDEGICYCIDKKYETEFEEAIKKNISLYI